MKKHALDTALLVSKENEYAHAFAQRYFYGIMFVMMFFAALFSLLPNSWFTSETLIFVSHWVRSSWPKLGYDAGVLEAVGAISGNKYTIFVLGCAGIMTIGTAAVLPIIAWHLCRGSAQPLSSAEIGVWWKALIVILVFVYFTIFDTGLMGSDTRLGRAVTRSWWVWFWNALLWCAQFLALGSLTVFTLRRWRFGVAEDAWTHRERKYHDYRDW